MTVNDASISLTRGAGVTREMAIVASTNDNTTIRGKIQRVEHQTFDKLVLNTTTATPCGDMNQMEHTDTNGYNPLYRIGTPRGTLISAGARARETDWTPQSWSPRIDSTLWKNTEMTTPTASRRLPLETPESRAHALDTDVVVPVQPRNTYNSSPFFPRRATLSETETLVCNLKTCQS